MQTGHNNRARKQQRPYKKEYDSDDNSTTSAHHKRKAKHSILAILWLAACMCVGCVATGGECVAVDAATAFMRRRRPLTRIHILLLHFHSRVERATVRVFE